MDVDVEVINFLLRANMFELRYNFEIWERQVDGSLYPKRMLTGASIYENRIHLRMIKIKQVIVLFILLLISKFIFHFFLNLDEGKRYFPIIRLKISK